MLRIEAADIFITAFHIAVWQTIGIVRSQLVIVVRAITLWSVVPWAIFSRAVSGSGLLQIVFLLINNIFLVLAIDF